MAGQYFDAETGLHYNYHRYYDPSIGRYLRPDPIGFNGGINLYAYVQNNPINDIDPQGLKTCPGADCPGGEWEGTSIFGLAGFVGGGVTVDRIFWQCKTSGATCEAVYICFGGGVIGEASLDLVGTAKASTAYNRKDLIGWSTGYRAAGGLGGGSISGTRTVGIENNAVIEHGSGGVGEGGGLAKITCFTSSTTCH